MQSSSVQARPHLTAALALATAGKEVLVLEQHDRPGSWTHSFTWNGYRFSPGVHYIGTLEDGYVRVVRVFEAADGTRGHVEGRGGEGGAGVMKFPFS